MRDICGAYRYTINYGRDLYPFVYYCFLLLNSVVSSLKKVYFSCYTVGSVDTRAFVILYTRMYLEKLVFLSPFGRGTEGMYAA